MSVQTLVGTPDFDDLMYDMTRPDYEPSSTKADLREYLSRFEFKNMLNEWTNAYAIYNMRMIDGERPGQAFMNALRDETGYAKLTGTLLDPFHKSDKTAMRHILIALDYLILSE